MELQQENIVQSQDKKPSRFKEFHCNYCTRKFNARQNLTRHVSVVHHNVRPFSCENCKKAFASKQDLVRHSGKGCLKFGQFRCEKCDKKFIPKMHYAVKYCPYCPKCDVHFDSREKIVEPFINQQIVKHCTQLSLSNFQNTIAVGNQPGPENLNTLFTCEGCFRSFYTSRGLAAHRTYCTQTLTSCLKCNFWFSSKRKLELHVCSILCSKCDVLFYSRQFRPPFQKLCRS